MSLNFLAVFVAIEDVLNTFTRIQNAADRSVVIQSVDQKQMCIRDRLGSMQSPITNFARVIKQIAEKDGEVAAEAPAEAAEEAPATEE